MYETSTSDNPEHCVSMLFVSTQAPFIIDNEAVLKASLPISADEKLSLMDRKKWMKSHYTYGYCKKIWLGMINPQSPDRMFLRFRQ